jgi:hypothetical protein
MHMAFAQRVIDDPALAPYQTLIDAHWGAFLLGNIAPDARVSSGIRRADTHFFEYAPEIDPPAMTAMLAQFPMLARNKITSDAQAVFIAGYLAHLAMDEVWCTDILYPYFTKLWDGNFTSFTMLHICLGWLDARDRATLPTATQYPALAGATPHDWLPFIPDSALIDWREIVARQIAPEGRSETLQILGQRVKMNEAEMREFIESEKAMNDYLWHNIPREAITANDQHMYERARDNILNYLSPPKD